MVRLNCFEYVFFSDKDPFAAMRLIQVCGVDMFCHVITAIPPGSTASFCEERDDAIADTMGVIHGTPMKPDQSTHALPIVAGGTWLPSLLASASSTTWVPSSASRAPLPPGLLLWAGGTTTARATTLLADPAAVSDSYASAASLFEAHSAALAMQTSFTGPELHTISLVAPRGNII